MSRVGYFGVGGEFVSAAWKERGEDIERDGG
jgi:hypothetical protein